MNKAQLEALGNFTIDKNVTIMNICNVFGKYHVLLTDRDGAKEAIISRDGTTAMEYLLCPTEQNKN